MKKLDIDLDLPKAIVACGAIVGVLLFAGMIIVSRTDIYVKSLGGGELTSGKIPNTISVKGDGKVFAKPDMLTFSVSISELSSTSQESLKKANEKVDEIRRVLREEGVSNDDIQTSNFSIYPEYDFNRERRLTGQRATQTLSVKVKKIDSAASKAAKIIDRVAAIQNISVQNIAFDIEDKTSIISMAREAAFKKAEQKATELAALGKVSLLKPISIADDYVDYGGPVYRNVGVAEDTAAGDGAKPSTGNTGLETGQLEITITLSVLFGID